MSSPPLNSFLSQTIIIVAHAQKSLFRKLRPFFDVHMFSNVFPLRYVLFDSTNVLSYNIIVTHVFDQIPKTNLSTVFKSTCMFLILEKIKQIFLFFLTNLNPFFVISFETLDINSKIIYNQALLAYKRSAPF